MATKRSKKRKTKMKKNLKFEFYGILLLALSVISLPKQGFGFIGSYSHALLRIIAGHWDFVLNLFGIYIALYIMRKRTFPFPWTLRKTGILFIFLAILLMGHNGFVDLIQQNGQYTDVNILTATWEALAEDRSSDVNLEVGGGMLGALFYLLFHYLFGDAGIVVMIITFFLTGILLTFHFSYVDFIKKLKDKLVAFMKLLQEKTKDFLLLMHEKKEKKPKKSQQQRQPGYKETNQTVEQNQEPIIYDFLNRTDQMGPQHQSLESSHEQPSLSKEEEQLEETQEIALNGISLEAVKAEEENYTIPPFHLLNRPDIMDQGNEFRDISKNAKKLEATLESFGVKAKVTQIHRGPAVTRYEIQPDIGVKVNRIVNLSDDIALALAAKDIRIEAPIPGKSAIGIEVPNSEIAVVTLREVLESYQFYESQSKLSLALGRDISGEPIIGNLAKMPHLLVAGATGSGKSVSINGMITSILYKAKPSEVKLLMIDPKMVELNVYNGIPHLLAPVVTNPKKAAKALKMIVNEMEKRYEKFSEVGARDIERYNTIMMTESVEDPNKQLLPYIVVIIDELADLMMVAPNDVEEAIIRLAQKARAAGIHLIVATQRPSVDVITGLIKANIPSRIAFGVSSQTDSRTILDMNGAEKLLGRGDMLYLPVGASKPVRIQGAFISDVEVEEIVQFVKAQQKANYNEDLIPDINPANENDTAEDELFYDAVELVLENNQASVSLLQRRLRIGYTRAARLIDEMEEKGFVGPYEGSKPRKVLITKEQYHQMKIPG